MAKVTTRCCCAAQLWCGMALEPPAVGFWGTISPGQGLNFGRPRDARHTVGDLTPIGLA